MKTKSTFQETGNPSFDAERRRLLAAQEREDLAAPATEVILASETAPPPPDRVVNYLAPGDPGIRRLKQVPYGVGREVAKRIPRAKLVSADEFKTLCAAEKEIDGHFANLGKFGADSAKRDHAAQQDKFLAGGEDAVAGGQMFSLAEFEHDYANRRAALRNAAKEAGRRVAPLIDTIGKRFLAEMPAIIEAVEAEDRAKYETFGCGFAYQPSMLLVCLHSLADKVRATTAHDPSANNFGKPSQQLAYVLQVP